MYVHQVSATVVIVQAFFMVKWLNVVNKQNDGLRYLFENVCIPKYYWRNRF